LDPDSHTLLNVNRAFAQMHGYIIDDLLGKSLVELVDQPEREDVRQLLQSGTEGGDTAYEAQHVRYDGSRFPVRANLTAYRSSAGILLFYGAILYDITERRRAQADLDISQARLTVALQGTDAALFDLDVPTMTLKWAGQPDQVFGLTSWRSVSRLEDWLQTVDPEDFHEVRRAVEDLLAGNKSEQGCEYRIRRPNGQRVWVKSRLGLSRTLLAASST
jgi:PAS domain S-box-containing protein